MTASDCVARYIAAKDQNRPHLLRSAFADDAKLVMEVKTGTISFPPTVNGREGIADVLVRRFGQTYENVHTLCLTEPPAPDATTFSCNWLVGMSSKADGEVRVWCGRYDWVFASGLARRVDQLTITIEEMVVLPPSELSRVMLWLSGLPETWCDAEDAFFDAPHIQLLDPITNYCKQQPRSNS